MPTKTRTHRVTTKAPVQEAGANGHSVEPKLLTREDILGARDVATKVVEVPEWGGAVVVRGLTGRARDALEARFSNERGSGIDRTSYPDFRAAWAALSIVDESGKQLFNESDVQALGEKSSVALQRIYEAGIELSAVRPEDVDGMVADLKADPSASSGSD